MGRMFFYSSVIVFFLLMPGNGMAAGMKSTASQNLQHYQGMTLSACLKEVAPEADLLAFQKKYLHTAEKKCMTMLAEKRRKTAIVTPADGKAPAKTAETDGKDTDDTTSKTAGTASAQPHHYWRNDGTH